MKGIKAKYHMYVMQLLERGGLCSSDINENIQKKKKFDRFPIVKFALISIHTLQLNFLFSDWLFSKYAECIENVHCASRTAPRLHEVLFVRDRVR